EQASRTAAFLAAMPVSATKLGSTKLLTTVIASLIPVVCLTVLGLCLRTIPDEDPLHQTTNWIWFAAACALSTIHIALTTATFGTGQRTELMAAGRGLLAFAVWGIACAVAIVAACHTVRPWLTTILLVGLPWYIL